MITEEYKLIYTSLISDGKVYLHPQHSKKEIIENSTIGKRLADHNKVVLLPIHVQTKSVKNPDAVIDGQLADFKSPRLAHNFEGAIQGCISKANKQKVAIVVINIDNPAATKDALKEGIRKAFFIDESRNRQIREVWLLYSNETLIELTKKEIRDLSYLDKIP
jgi:Contact-dependent growth inhibition CdiA C-terminal domain